MRSANTLLSLFLAFTVLGTSALPSQNHGHTLHHRKIAARQQTSSTTGSVARRCKARSSSASAPSATSSSTQAVLEASTPHASPTPTTTAVVEKPSPTTKEATVTTKKATTTKAAATTTKAAPTTTTKAPAPTTTTEAAAPPSTPASGSSPDNYYAGTNTGQATWYNTGLDACGFTDSDSSSFIAAVSTTLFDNYPGYTGANPNNNPICNKQIKATYQGKSVTVRVTDRCGACAPTDLDFSPLAFEQLADQSVGRLSGMTWEWV